MASRQQRAARGDDGPEGYALGDVTRIGVQTIKDIFKGTADGTREITGGIKQRWQEEQYGITGPLPASGAGPSSAGAGPSGTTSLVAGAPAAAPSSAPSSRKTVSLLGDVHAMPGAASGGTAALGCVAKGAGVVWGVGKELVLGAGLGVAKGAVALVDKGVEAAAPHMMSPPQQQEAQHRLDAFSRSVAAEMAPVIGMMASQFATGAVEGMGKAQEGMGKAYEAVVPSAVQADLEQRLEKRLGAMMQHLVEPAVQEAVLNLYIGKLKPLLTQDKWMPPAVR